MKLNQVLYRGVIVPGEAKDETVEVRKPRGELSLVDGVSSLAFSTENSSSVMRPSSRSSFRCRSNDGLFAMDDCMEMDHLGDQVSPRSHRALQTHVQAHVNVD